MYVDTLSTLKQRKHCTYFVMQHSGSGVRMVSFHIGHMDAVRGHGVGTHLRHSLVHSAHKRKDLLHQVESFNAVLEGHKEGEREEK